MADDNKEFDEYDEVEIMDALYNKQNKGEFDDVLQLTEYTNGDMLPDKAPIYAEYIDIELTEVQKKHQLTAQNFMNKLTKFILEFKDVQLTAQHEAYIKEAAKFQLNQLEDLLMLVDVNKQMLNNIIRRVNATQAEDYAIINTYNSLSNQHLKLLKELQNTYRSAPSVLKKMKADITCNQDIEDNESEVITENYGISHFNNSKQLLKNLIEKEEAEASKLNNGNE